jgi:hypothetical protein
MRPTIALLSIIVALFISNRTGEDTWNEIKDKTWTSSEVGPMGGQLVFLQDKSGKRAIIQWGGSGCCQILTFVYDVELLDDTIRLFSLNNPKGLAFSGKEYYSTLVFSRQLKSLYDKELKCSYRLQFDKPHLYKSCCTELEIEKLVSDTINFLDFK